MIKYCLLYILPILLFPNYGMSQIDTFALAGYATVNGNTTGGQGGDTVTVTTGNELQDAIKNKGNNPLIIYVDGIITPANSVGLSKIDVKDVEDISILGRGYGAEFNGIGIKLWRTSNIILRNLKIHHVDIGDKDCISIEGPTDHVWVDHCELYNEYQTVGKDDYDGLFDIKKSTDYITFSWNYLHDSWKCSLSGSSESDTFNRHVTYHHNLYENANSRMPLFRGGTGHIFNNYYVDVVSTAINSRINACILIENNYFENVHNPWVSAYSNILGAVDTIGNIRDNSPFDYSASDTHQPLSCTLSVPYDYSHVLMDATDIPSVVEQNAGVGKLFISTTSTAIEDELGEKISVFPNPASEVVNVNMEISKAANVGLEVYSLMGQKVREIKEQLLPQGKADLQIKT
ncbi:MAG: hypothetical protein KDD99_30545, partial [Bacteroidetes bacterium]|nr:hypothetical protein [Bacteroidota bacterium]